MRQQQAQATGGCALREHQDVARYVGAIEALVVFRRLATEAARIYSLVFTSNLESVDIALCFLPKTVFCVKN